MLLSNAAFSKDVSILFACIVFTFFEGVSLTSFFSFFAGTWLTPQLSIEASSLRRSTTRCAASTDQRPSFTACVPPTAPRNMRFTGAHIEFFLKKMLLGWDKISCKCILCQSSCNSGVSTTTHSSQTHKIYPLAFQRVYKVCREHSHENENFNILLGGNVCVEAGEQ